MGVEGGEDGEAAPQIRGRWRRVRRPMDGEPSYAGLGAQVERILRLAEETARDLREEARRDAAATLERAEQDAARIRAEAEADARAIRAEAAGGPG